MEPLVGFHARQTQGGPAFEREHVARVVHELGNDLIGFRVERRGYDRGRWALAGWCRGLFHRAWQQACHGQDTRLAGWPPGFLPEQIADLLAHGFAQLPLEGRIGCGEWLGQMTQIVGLAELMTAVGQDRGDGWHQTRLFVAEYGQNRPLQVLQGREERLERDLIQLSKPPTAKRQPCC